MASMVPHRRSVLGWSWAATALAAVLAAVLAVGACGNENSAATQPRPAGKSRYVLGFVAKSASNPVYLAARAGAEAAARELGAAHGVQIEIVWRSPIEEDSSRQYEILGELVASRVDAIAISCTDAALITPAIDAAMTAGIQVMTFDADAPDSRRIAFYGIDDHEAGATVFRELVRVMGRPGRIAVLAGNRAAENIRNRVLGAARERRAQDEVEIVGVFHHDETPHAATAAMIEAHAKHGPIDGWALVGGWPLYDPAGLDGVPADVLIVSMDPLPPALDHAEAGRVHAFVAQPYYGWGYESVKTLFERLHLGRKPDPVIRHAPLRLILPEDADSYRQEWVGWVGKVNAGQG